MPIRLEIEDDQLLYRTGIGSMLTAPLADVLAAAAQRADWQALPDAIPDGVRFIRRQGDVVLLALEEPPAVRTVRWLTDDSPAPFGPKARYQTARLAFPFVVLVLALRAGALTEWGQCFYRVAPVRTLDDPLLLPNLRNVARAHGQLSWVCLRKLGAHLGALAWADKVRHIREHFWQAGFNSSCDVSYWHTMREVDARVASITAWEEATERDRFFPLTVAWRPSGQTLRSIMDDTVRALALPGPPNNAEELMPLMTAHARPVRRRRSKA